MVKRGVKDRHLGHLATEECARGKNSLDAVWIVQWGEIDALFDFFQDILGDDRRLFKALSAVDHAVSDRVDVAHAFNFLDAGLIGGCPTNHEIERGGNVPQGSGDGLFGAVALANGDDRFSADAFDFAA